MYAQTQSHVQLWSQSVVPQAALSWRGALERVATSFSALCSLVQTITGFSCFAFFGQCVKGYFILQNVFL